MKEFRGFNIPSEVYKPMQLSTFRPFELGDCSMPPLEPGAIIVGELMNNKNFQEGERYIIVHHEGIFFKRVFKGENTVILRSDNEEFEDIEINELDEMELWNIFHIINNNQH